MKTTKSRARIPVSEVLDVQAMTSSVHCPARLMGACNPSAVGSEVRTGDP